jgi:hypothetical protein
MVHMHPMKVSTNRGIAMHTDTNLHSLGKLTTKEPMTEKELRAALPPALRGSGLTELIKSFLVEVISVPMLNKRRKKFNDKLDAGYEGPIVVAEGDSWFLYPVELIDVIGHLDDRFAILEEALPGDTTTRMLDFIGQLKQQIAYYKPDAFLFSGGGNDLLGDGKLVKLLEPGDLPRPTDYIGPRMRAEMTRIMGNYATILMEVRTIIADLPVIIHGYDYAIPQPGGTWFGKPMDQLGIPADAGKRAMIVRAMMDDFHARLTDFARAYSHVTYVDLRGTVPGTEWFDELHPTTKAFGYVAAKIGAEIAKIKPLVS